MCCHLVAMVNFRFHIKEQDVFLRLIRTCNSATRSNSRNFSVSCQHRFGPSQEDWARKSLWARELMWYFCTQPHLFLHISLHTRPRKIFWKGSRTENGSYLAPYVWANYYRAPYWWVFSACTHTAVVFNFVRLRTPLDTYNFSYNFKMDYGLTEANPGHGEKDTELGLI